VPRRDANHEAVTRALIKDGWTITHDPSTISFRDDRAFIDLGAERLLGAARDQHLIAAEIKPFTGPSVIADVEQAIGQYLLYRSWLARVDRARTLWLAVDVEAAVNVLPRPAMGVLVVDDALRLLVVNNPREEIIEWRS